MKKIMKRGLSLLLALIMVTGLLPVTAFAAVDSSGKPTDLNNTLVLSFYTGDGFPGEPAVYGTGNYKNINSSFAVRSGATFASTATNQLDWNKISKDIVQGASSGNTSVWGVYDANGTKDYFLPNASIIDPDNEIKMIRAVTGCSAAEAKNYEIIWYVIKLQHNPGSGWFSRASTEWHIDGIIKEKAKISINYYGNGNTSGNAPLGVTDHGSGETYVVKGLNDSANPLKKVINGVEVSFLGWSAKADGTGAEAGFYQPGDVITPTESLSLYAMWDTTTQHTATVNTYLDGVLTDDSDIHGTARDLYLSTDSEHYYRLTRNQEGVYTVNITGNGKFHLFNKDGGTYTQADTHQLTIYNQNGSLDVHHYSVTYDPNEGEFAADPGKQAFLHDSAVTAIESVPTREGYRFLGWKDSSGKLIQPGEAVTAAITEPITLTAQWEKTVNVTINVTINHEGGGGYDQMASKDDVSLALVSRANDGSPYLEVEGKTLTLDKGTVPEEQKVTQYTGNTFTDMPGGEVDYTVVTSKSGYDTTITPTQDRDGNWIIDVVMTYNPTNFDLDFTVEVDNSVPDRYLPDAAIVKVTFWSVDRQQWEIITQQEGGLPGVRVAIDPNTRSGSGSYPVWKYESNGTTPYGYRIQTTSFIYPDGTIVPASEVVTQDVAWTDNVYTATVSDVTGGRKFGTLDGAYIGAAGQEGKLNAVISMELYNVTFDAQGGKVNGKDSQTVTEQYKIPGFKDYVPVRQGGYTFAGWFEDAECTVAATEGKDLTQSITLYAKWIEPLTISGTVEIAGTYQQNGETVSVHDIDRAAEAVVVLQEIRGGSVYDVDSETVSFGNYEDTGSAEYSFTGLPNDGKLYQIHVLVLNYGTAYDNEGDSDSRFTPSEYTAVFGDDNVADVDAHLEFVPPSYDQHLHVDATAIGSAFRPKNVLSEVMYRDTGDNHAFQRISQHDVEPYGVNILLNNGTGSGTESIWKWHTDGTLYDYQMNVTRVDGAAYDSDTAPFYITYANAAYWDGGANAPSGELKATLIPKQYLVAFDLNADGDTVTGMEDYKLSYTDDTGTEVATDTYGVIHTWSFDTPIAAVPQREGYTFLGWEANVENAYTNDTISAAVHQEVTLTARWEKVTYEVTTVADPAEGGTVTGAGTYDHRSTVTIQATPKAGYSFLGWYENDELVAGDLSYRFNILDNHDFTARFSLNQHKLETSAIPSDGGTTAGDGVYDYGAEVTVSATVNEGYTFAGWYNGSEKVSDELEFHVTVTENLSYTAMFERNQYSVTTGASPAEGGSTSGDGTYFHGDPVTVKATAQTGYVFTGWFEDGKLVSEDAEYRFDVTGNRVLTATFEQITYQVTANAERGGTAEGTAAYHYGDTATVKATVGATFTFDGWYEGTAKVSDALEYTFTVTADRALTAKFIKNGFNVETKHTDGGTTAGDGYYEEGETATVTATADQGYMFIGWFDEAGAEVSNSAQYSFTVTSNRVLTAKFATAYTVTTIASPNGAGMLSGGGTHTAGTNVTIAALANSGYYFVGWYDENGELVTADASYSLILLENRTFTAKFEAKKSYRCDYVYLFGYNDSEIGATGPLLRGELSQMIYRLVKQNRGVSNGGNSFSDTAGEWFESGISYMAEVGAIDRSKSNAYPYASVSCGETYKMICLGLGFTTDTELSFSEYAAILCNSGFPANGSVTSKIQRYQFCELFNAILGRSNYCTGPDGYIATNGTEVTAETYGYTDLNPGDSYYRTMMIATSTFTDGKIDVEKRIDRNTYDYTN